MEIKDIVGKKVAIWCDTEEKAIDCVARMNNLSDGFKLKSTCYTHYFDKTSYSMFYRSPGYENKEWFILNGYEIISYNDFFGISEQVDSETLTTVEIVEWISKNYYEYTWGEAIGFTDDIKCIVEKLGAEEVIKRITAYELEKRKAKVSDEEITLLLGEK